MVLGSFILPKIEPIFRCTCSSRSANLLIKCIPADKLLEEVNKVISAFRDPKETPKKWYWTEVLPSNIRFCYLRDNIESIIKNLEKMREIIVEAGCEISRQACDLVNDPTFEISISIMYEILTSICILINTFQNPKVKIADATELWLKLKLPLNDYNYIIKQRINEAFLPVRYAANFSQQDQYEGLRMNEE